MKNDDLIYFQITMNGSSADQSIRYVLEHALRSVIRLNKLARTELFIEINVLADDGGVLSACLLCAGVAIASANIEM
jgi:ribonuclease PH